MKTCWFCEKIEPVDNLYYNKEFKTNVHLKCIGETMRLRRKKNQKKPRELIDEADQMAYMLVDRDRLDPK